MHLTISLALVMATVVLLPQRVLSNSKRHQRYYNFLPPFLLSGSNFSNSLTAPYRSLILTISPLPPYRLLLLVPF